MDLGIKGRAAVVTGASRGLGRAIATGLAREGCSVLAVARTAASLKSLEASSGGMIVGAVCDLADGPDVEQLVDRALDCFGRLDAVVNNAGIAPGKLLLDSDNAHWQHVFAVNVFAPVALSRAAGRVFVQQRSGKVINISSIAGLVGRRTITAYSASKAALIRFSESLAHEWSAYNVQVNVIAPGGFDTEAQREALSTPELAAIRTRRIPAGRLGEPSEIASLACYLASPISDFATGAVYVLDGGEISHL